jgi:hypothetical protein
MSKYILPGNRIMDRGYIRDGKLIHTGEAFALAVLLHSKGRGRFTKHEKEEIDQVTKVFRN